MWTSSVCVSPKKSSPQTWFEEEAPPQYAARMAHQDPEEIELLGRQRDLRPPHEDTVTPDVHHYRLRLEVFLLLVLSVHLRYSGVRPDFYVVIP
jgi:hypothetical protein